MVWHLMFIISYVYNLLEMSKAKTFVMEEYVVILSLS